MKEYKIHILWRESRESQSARTLNELELTKLSCDGWDVVGFFDKDNLCVLLQREKEDKNGLEK